MRVSVNLNFFFQEVPLLERYAKAAAAGFRLVEVAFPYTESAEDLKGAADKYGLKHSLINAPAGSTKGLAAIATRTEFSASIERAICYAKALDCSRVHVMAGVAPNTDETSVLYVDNIRTAAKKLNEEGILCLIEPINKYSIPGYFLSCYDQALNVLRTVDSSNLKIQFDVFHAQQICGQLSATMKSLKNEIGYVQVAQVPDRREPSDVGELNYSYLFSVLQNLNDNLIVGCEYSPSDNDDRSWVRKYGLEF